MILIIGIFAVGLAVATDATRCSIPKPDVPNEWQNMHSKCIVAILKHIEDEFNATFLYLSMATFFSKDTVNRLGLSEYYFKAAHTKRQHAANLMEYLSMRGSNQDSILDLIKYPTVQIVAWNGVAESLTDALQVETKMTKSINNVIKLCESNPADYHVIKHLSSIFLDDQYKIQREIAEKIATLKKMMKNHGSVAEFVFDKSLLTAATLF